MLIEFKLILIFQQKTFKLVDFWAKLALLDIEFYIVLVCLLNFQLAFFYLLSTGITFNLQLWIILKELVLQAFLKLINVLLFFFKHFCFPIDFSLFLLKYLVQIFELSLKFFLFGCTLCLSHLQLIFKNKYFFLKFVEILFRS